MILSMTGFGEARAQVDGVSFRVEVRSVNNRYFKSSMRLPEHMQRFEADLDRQLRERLSRGSVSYTLRVTADEPAAACVVNQPALRHYMTKLREAAEDRPGVTIDLSGLLALPGVCESPEIEEGVLLAQFQVVQRLTAEALEKLVAMRRQEGAALERDLQAQCAELRARFEQVRQRSPLVVEEYAKRLRARVQQLLSSSNLELEQDALAREVAIFAERCDVNEEIARAVSHLDQFAAVCAAGEEAGRKLEFLAQELLREANTMGSKANDAEIARHIVVIKAAIDRIKEQVQNVA